MSIATRSISPTPPGVAFSRYAKGLVLGAPFAEANFRDQPQIAHALAERFLLKSAVPGATLDAMPTLGSLGVADASLALPLAAHSAFEAARSRMRELPFEVAVPRETASGTGGGPITEGSATPVATFAFDPVRLKPVQWGSTVVVTEDLVRNKQSDVVLRDALPGAAGRTETTAFLDPSVAPVGSHPASITLLRRLVRGRLRFLPQRDGTYKFTGKGTVEPVLAGVIPNVASPTGFGIDYQQVFEGIWVSDRAA